MFAEQRGRLDLDVVGRYLDWVAERRVPPARRVVDVHRHLAGAQVRVLQHPQAAAPCPAKHALSMGRQDAVPVALVDRSITFLSVIAIGAAIFLVVQMW